jgi:hypothetical protein
LAQDNRLSAGWFRLKYQEKSIILGLLATGWQPADYFGGDGQARTAMSCL